MVQVKILNAIVISSLEFSLDSLIERELVCSEWFDRKI